MSVIKLPRNRGTWDHRPEAVPVSALQSWTAHGAMDVALALAIGREHPGDWRPEALLWLYSRDERSVDRVRHGVAVGTLAHAARFNVCVTPALLAAAVQDGMRMVRRDPCMLAETRAKQLRATLQEFLDLRRFARVVLLRAVKSGLVHYVAACGYAPGMREVSAPKTAHHENHGRTKRAA